MYKNTHQPLESIDFKKLVLKLISYNPTNNRGLEHYCDKTLLLIALTTGLPLNRIVKLKWSDLLKLDSRGVIQVKEKLKSHFPYDIPISEKLFSKILLDYYSLILPNFNEKIIEGFYSLEIAKIEVKKNIVELLNLFYGDLSIIEIESIYKDKNISQILFGRRVFEVNGYSTISVNFLTKHFNFITKSELLNFLGYESKHKIKYSISKIPLIKGENESYLFKEPKYFLEDNKHFLIKKPDGDGYYPFQHFEVFYKFLQFQKLNHDPIIFQAVRILLWISLVNGIRLSTLIKINWASLFEIDETNKILKLKKQLRFDRFTINIYQDQFKPITDYFINVMKNYNILDVKVDAENNIHISDFSKLNTSCFITNTGGPLTQSSLSREIKNYFKKCKSPFVDRFSTKSTLIMYGRRVIELKGLHTPTIRDLKKHFKIRKTQDLFDFLFINEYKGFKGSLIEEYENIFEHILYDI